MSRRKPPESPVTVMTVLGRQVVEAEKRLAKAATQVRGAEENLQASDERLSKLKEAERLIEEVAAGETTRS